MTKEAYYKEQWLKTFMLTSKIICKLPPTRITPDIQHSYNELLGEYIKNRDQENRRQISELTLKGPKQR